MISTLILKNIYRVFCNLDLFKEVKSCVLKILSGHSAKSFFLDLLNNLLSTKSQLQREFLISSLKEK